MAAKVLPNIRREETVQMKNRLLFDIYRREGGELFRQNKYKEAIASYDAALEIDGDSKVALMAKSRCFFEMGLFQHSLVDCESVLAMDNTYPDALYQKAEIFFALDNYEMALLFYHRGHKLKYPGFQEGIDRCKKAVKHSSSGRTMKLTPAGDLTIYVHRKMQKLSRRRRSTDLGFVGRDPSAVNYRLNLSPNPLVRLDKKDRTRAKSYRLANRHAMSQKATNQRVYSDRPVNYRNQTSNENRHGQKGSQSERPADYDEYGYHDNPDERSMRIILGKLYGDKKYLEQFVVKTDNQSKFHNSVRWLAEDGLGFLHDRIQYWSCTSVQPSPPPSPPLSQKHAHQANREKRDTAASPALRQRSSLWQREVSEFIRNLESPDVSDVDDVRIEQIRRVRRNQKTIKAENINFVFKSLRPDSVDQRRQGAAVKTSPLQQISEEDDVDDDSIHMYLIKELQDIQEVFDKSDFAECSRRCTVCLQTVKQYSKEEISDKRDLVARVHSYLGNALLELQEYDKAIVHHERDLEIGEECKIDEPVSRALGNLGRAYLLKKHYHKALGAFARKIKLATKPVERAWLFHEIGNCFLCLHQHQHTCACALKSLDAAIEADNRLYQLQSSVLLAVAQVKLEQFEAAHSTFERALDLARLQGDTQSEELIKVALSDVNKNISRELKDKLLIREASQSLLVNNENTSSIDNTQQRTNTSNNEETQGLNNFQEESGSCKNEETHGLNAVPEDSSSKNEDIDNVHKEIGSKNEETHGDGTVQEDNGSKTEEMDSVNQRIGSSKSRRSQNNNVNTNHEQNMLEHDSVNDGNDYEHGKSPGASRHSQSSFRERNSLRGSIKSVDKELKENDPVAWLNASSTVGDSSLKHGDSSLNHGDSNITGGNRKVEEDLDYRQRAKKNMSDVNDMTSSDKQQNKTIDMTSSSNEKQTENSGSESVDERKRPTSNILVKTPPPLTLREKIEDELHKNNIESEL